MARRRVRRFVGDQVSVELPERTGQPPCVPAEQSQGGREEQAAYEERVDEDGERGPDAEDLEDDDV